MKIKVFAYILLLFTTTRVVMAQRMEVEYSTVSEEVVATVNKEYGDSKNVAKAELDKNGFYKISIQLKDQPVEVILIKPDGKWLRKSSFIQMTESDITLIMKVQDMLGSTDGILYWTRATFPDGTIEYRVSRGDGRVHCWDNHFNHLGVVVDLMFPARGKNLQKPRS